MKNNVLPLALYTNPSVKTIMHAGDSCILFKRLTGDLREQEKISTSHCMTFVAKGTVEVKTYEGHYVTAGEDELLFMPQDTYTISDLILEHEAIEVFLVFFDQEIVMDFLRATGMKRYPTNAQCSSICKLNTSGNVPQYFTALKEMYLSIDSAPHLLKIKILEFLHLVHRDNPHLILSTLAASDVQKRRRSIETIMLNNYDSALTIADYAKLSGRSLSTFNRDFKRKYGQTPKQWLIHKKMEKAEQLLAGGTNVTRCAAEVGYSNVSHFIKAYKLIHGTTPNGARNRSA